MNTVDIFSGHVSEAHKTGNLPISDGGPIESTYKIDLAVACQ